MLVCSLSLTWDICAPGRCHSPEGQQGALWPCCPAEAAGLRPWLCHLGWFELRPYKPDRVPQQLPAGSQHQALHGVRQKTWRWKDFAIK